MYKEKVDASFYVEMSLRLSRVIDLCSRCFKWRFVAAGQLQEWKCEHHKPSTATFYRQ